MKPILIFGLYPRCGTTSLMYALSNSICADWLFEPFNEDWSSSSSFLSNSISVFNKDINYLLNTCEKYNIKLVKTLAYQFDLDLNIAMINSLKTILMYRRFFIDSFVSNWLSYNFKVKTSINAYNIDSIINNKEFYKIVRDPININHVYEDYKKAKLIKKSIEKKCSVFCDLAYEDYYNEEVIKNHENLVKALGFSIGSQEYKKYIDSSQKINKQEFFERLIPNYNKINQYRNELIL